MMIYKVKNGDEVLNQNGCVGTRLYEAAGNEYVILSIKPGGAIPEHALPLSVSFCVLKGMGVCSVNGDLMTMTAGQMAECPPDVPRAWKNESDEQLEVLVIKRSAF